MYTHYIHTHTPKPIHTYYDIRALAALARVVCARVHPQKKCWQTAGYRQCHPPSLKVYTQQGTQYTTYTHRQHSYTHTHTQRHTDSTATYIHTERHTDNTHSYTCTAHTATHTERRTQHSYTLTILRYYFTTVYTVLVYSSRGEGPRPPGAGLASQPRRKETERYTTHRDRETHNTQRHTTHMHKQTHTQYIHTCIVGRGVPCPLPLP